MSNGIDCWRCGAHTMNPPYLCPKGGSLDDTDETESGKFADGNYYVHGWCDSGDGQPVLIRCDEWMIDPANTAPHVQKYATEKGYAVEVQCAAVKDGNDNWSDKVVVLKSDGEGFTVLGSSYRQCVRRLDEMMSGN